ncbi:hypothetical protein [Psychrobacter sp. I-STPA10]|uniref:hypothetical protein n=1 Tax=Psychrobacter sp. I-STPA10 TaxID=2585769 RepID=UPI001E492ECC|nr:hypothetical protein [Psychrobacter sp. I-STPA10]
MLDRLVVFFGHGIRGVLLGTAYLIFVIVLDSFIPESTSSFLGEISMAPFHTLLLFLGLIGFLSLTIQLWIKDWERGYIPSWYITK